MNKWTFRLLLCSQIICFGLILCAMFFDARELVLLRIVNQAILNDGYWRGERTSLAFDSELTRLDKELKCILYPSTNGSCEYFDEQYQVEKIQGMQDFARFIWKQELLCRYWNNAMSFDDDIKRVGRNQSFFLDFYNFKMYLFRSAVLNFEKSIGHHPIEIDVANRFYSYQKVVRGMNVPPTSLLAEDEESVCNDWKKQRDLVGSSDLFQRFEFGQDMERACQK